MAVKSGRGASSTGVTLEEVAAVVRELQLEGVTPTVRAVREQLGRGSFTTLGAHLGLVLAGIETPQQQLEQFGPRLQELCLEMTEHMKEMATQQVSREREQLEARRQHIEQRWSAMQLDLENAVRDLERERKATLQANERIREMEAAQAALQQQLGQQIRAATEAQTQLTLFVERSTRAEADAQQARLQRDHFETQMTEQRRLDLEAQQQQQARLEHELSAARSSMAQLSENNARLASERQGLHVQLGHAIEQLEAGKKNVAALGAQVTVIAAEKAESVAASQQLTAQLLEAQKRIEDKGLLVESLQDRLLSQQERYEADRERRDQEGHALVRSLVTHSRKIFNVLKEGSKDSAKNLAELEIAQQEIERLFPIS